ncbi:hypothetical protein ACLOJK_008723 [Asimina triloba]
MDKEALLVESLFENIWFYSQILSPPTSSPPTLIRPSHSKPTPKPKKLRRPAISNNVCGSNSKAADPAAVILSPNSLPNPELGLILSGRAKPEDPIQQTKRQGRKRSKDPVLHRRKSAKSLSELEMEELKGFLDLGFTFDEREVDSRVVSIVPALQRLIGKNTAGAGGDEISRPYLSEAWGVGMCRSGGEENPLLNWRISATGDGIRVKEQLRWWAHAVASMVR